MSQLWLFIVAPVIGAAVAAGLYNVVRVSYVSITTREAEEGPGHTKREKLHKAA
jgi:hypothetical protein